MSQPTAAEVLAAEVAVLAKRHRLVLLHALADAGAGGRTLTELAGRLAITKPAALRHLDSLRRAGMVCRDYVGSDTGPVSRYRLVPESTHALADAIRALS